MDFINALVFSLFILSTLVLTIAICGRCKKSQKQTANKQIVAKSKISNQTSLPVTATKCNVDMTANKVVNELESKPDGLQTPKSIKSEKLKENPTPKSVKSEKLKERVWLTKDKSKKSEKIKSKKSEKIKSKKSEKQKVDEPKIVDEQKKKFISPQQTMGYKVITETQLVKADDQFKQKHPEQMIEPNKPQETMAYQIVTESRLAKAEQKLPKSPRRRKSVDRGQKFAPKPAHFSGYVWTPPPLEAEPADGKKVAEHRKDYQTFFIVKSTKLAASHYMPHQKEKDPDDIPRKKEKDPDYIPRKKEKNLDYKPRKKEKDPDYIPRKNEKDSDPNRRKTPASSSRTTD